MAEQFDISDLHPLSAAERLRAYAEAMPDGKVALLNDVAAEMGLSISPAHEAAKKGGVFLMGHMPSGGAGSSARAMIANPKTVKQWHDLQKQAKARKKG